MSTSDLRLGLINEIIKMDENTLISVSDIIQSNTTPTLEDWQREVLDERLKLHNENPNNGSDWDSAKKRLLSNL